ncbi:helix-turn-helix transcriptional regulator [Streptomyces sp. NPDC057854]|uniref:helix-turn-helix transcriptional regulator n=1 Tax=unclassified Streptomyces TaxID=2593676 RepID=UPI00367F3E6A
MNQISYYRFCCRIRIADADAEEVPGGEWLAIEVGDIRERHEQFADARLNPFSDWFNETPALLAHVRALQTDRSSDVRRRLVDTEAAVLYTGRDRQTLYRWAREGRITRHKVGGAGRRVMWDVLELPPSGSGRPPQGPAKKS